MALDDIFVQRVSGLEGDVKDLGQKVSSLESDVRSVARAVDDVGDVLKTLSSKFTDQTRTNWGVLGAWASVILSIGGMFGYLIYEPTQSDVTRNTEKLDYHLAAPSHGVAQAKLHALEQRLNLEIERINEVTTIRDEYLQTEIDRVKAEQQARTKRVYKN